mgnify:CR=1 FL=1
MLRSLGLACLAVLTFAAFPSAPHSDRAVRQSVEPAAWLSYGHDGQLTNCVRSDSLTAASAGRLKLGWSKRLDGAVVASPLYAEVSGLGKIVVFETEAGTVYALRPSNGAVVWKRTLGTMEPAAGCGTWGLSSTGVIDLQRGVVQNEKRQRENQPYGLVEQTITENTWPANHPYSWTVIGSMLIARMTIAGS